MKKTLNNLAKAFIGESQARNRYHYYAKVAKAEGYVQLSEIFSETADQEKEHASQIFKRIQELREQSDEKFGKIDEVDSFVPAEYGDSAENLKAAIEGEEWEETEMYPGFADEAEEEGYSEIADQLRAIALAEKHHKERYQKLLAEYEKDALLKKDEEVVWSCMECGYEHKGVEPPEECPSCKHDRGYYKVKCEVY